MLGFHALNFQHKAYFIGHFAFQCKMEIFCLQKNLNFMPRPGEMVFRVIQKLRELKGGENFKNAKHKTEKTKYSKGVQL